MADVPGACPRSPIAEHAKQALQHVARYILLAPESSLSPQLIEPQMSQNICKLEVLGGISHRVLGVLGVLGVSGVLALSHPQRHPTTNADAFCIKQVSPA